VGEAVTLTPDADRGTSADPPPVAPSLPGAGPLKLGTREATQERRAERIAARAMTSDGRATAPMPADEPREADAEREMPQGAADAVRAGLRGGRALTTAERDYFEPRLGADLGHVRLHDGSAADASATALQARAFAVGTHVVLARGAYAFGRDSGKRLLAHELAHVLNPGADGVVRRQAAAGAMGAAEWIAAAALGADVVSGLSDTTGDITYDFDEMQNVLLPGGRTDAQAYQEENPELQISRKELRISFWRGLEDERKAGVKVGFMFLTDDKGIGNITPRLIKPFDSVGWGASCAVDLQPESFVSEDGRAIIRMTLTNNWNFSWPVEVDSGTDSEVWLFEGNGNFTEVVSDDMMWLEHELVDFGGAQPTASGEANDEEGERE
jgi:hypothetical protein